MANYKCLRRLLRSAGRRQPILFFSTAHSHSRTHSADDRKLLKLHDHNIMQQAQIKLHDHNIMQQAQIKLYSTTNNDAVFMASSSARNPSNHFACLSQLHVRRCLPHAAPCSPASAGSSAFMSAAEAEDCSYDDDTQQQQLLRSHSCSKLQQGRRLMMPSFKSLLHRPHSQGQLSYDQHAANAEAAAERLSSTSHSWSPPNLRISLHRKKAAGCSFHGELDLQQGGNCSKGKPSTPKGHVAVYVNGGKERHVVPIPYLSHPYFQDLLGRAESEFGFGQKGGLLLPCSPAELHHTLHRIQNHPN